MKGKEYIRPIKSNWWLHNRHLMLFMLREVSSLFVAGYAVLLLVLLWSSNGSREAFDSFFGVLKSPGMIALQMVILAFVIVHTITTIHAAPVLLEFHRGDEKVDPRLIVGGHYAAWLILSLLVLLVFMW